LDYIKPLVVELSEHLQARKKGLVI
jgi:hypothetical protein